jgi:hypothetical protein
MPTFLQLCSRLRQEVGYADSGPTAVTGQVGAHARTVGWVSQTYIELQNRHNWRWLRRRFNFNTVAGTASYATGSVTDTTAAALIARFKRWAITDPRNPAKCYLTASGVGVEYWLSFMPWEDFRSIYQIGTQVPGAPAHITIDPQNNIVLGPTPGDIYTISGEYDRGAQVLAADGDTPEMPSDYHMLIVYLAMEDAGMYEVGEEIVQRARIKSRKMLRELEASQLPMMRRAGPMA